MTGFWWLFSIVRLLKKNEKHIIDLNLRYANDILIIDIVRL